MMKSSYGNFNQMALFECRALLHGLRSPPAAKTKNATCGESGGDNEAWSFGSEALEIIAV